MEALQPADARIQAYIRALSQIASGDLNTVELPAAGEDDLGQLGQALQQMLAQLRSQAEQTSALNAITAQASAGFTLEEILDNIYDNFRVVIPYNRLGLALIEPDGESVRAFWCRTDQPRLALAKDYLAPLAGSSLQDLLASGRPRILNDLEDYLAHKPDSSSTRLLVAEGIRASLTCPLFIEGKPVGFLFFSSIHTGAYASVHVEVFECIAGSLSMIVEKGRLVSELAAQKAEIERQNDELRRLVQLRDYFLGIAAHDLRGPLGYIQTSAYLLLSDEISAWDPAEAQNLIEGINRQVKYMVVLINDLLDFTAIQTRRLALSPESVELRSFIWQIIEDHQAQAAPKNTRINWEMDGAGQVQADPARLRQLLDNLISNAVKFSPPGSTVQVRVEQTADGWRVCVSDQGPGIRSEDFPRLFQPFTRLATRPTGGEKSTGLGLAISRWIAEAHGGQIGVESLPGQGATFWFTLPGTGQKEKF